MKSICYFLICGLLLAGCKTTHPVTSTKPVPETKPGGGPKPTQTVSLPVFIPTLQLQKQLYDNFFAPTEGKYYPCAGRTDCSDLYKDLYVENPVLKVKGDAMTIHLHLAGALNTGIFHPDASGDLLFSAKPVVKGDTLFFQDITMDHSSQGFLLGLASRFFEKQIIKKIQDNTWYSFRPLLDKYAQDFRKQMPLKFDSSVLLLSLNKIYLNSVTIQQPPNEGIIATFSAELTTEDTSYGQ